MLAFALLRYLLRARFGGQVGAASCIVVLAIAAIQAQGPSLRDRMLAAEDARAASATEMTPLLQGLRASDPKLLIPAVRGLGRLERPVLVTQLLPFVSHRRAEVRAEAINALGQALAAIPGFVGEVAAGGERAPPPPRAGG